MDFLLWQFDINLAYFPVRPIRQAPLTFCVAANHFDCAGCSFHRGDKRLRVSSSIAVASYGNATTDIPNYSLDAVEPEWLTARHCNVGVYNCGFPDFARVGLNLLKTVRTEAYRVSLPTFKNREWLGAIPWFMSNNAIGVFSVQLSFVILGYSSERVSEVGAFQLAVSFALFINLPLVIANLFLGPNIAAWWQAGELQANLKIVTRVTRIISLFSAAGSVLLLTFSDVILGALYGEDFVFVADALQIMVVGQLINVVFGPAGLMLMACGFERQALLGRTLGTAISIMVTIVTVREWGAVGAAYGVTAGLLVWNVWMMIKLREHVRTPILFLLGR